MAVKSILRIESFNMRDGKLTLTADNEGTRVVINDIVQKCKLKYGGYVKGSFSLPYRDRTLPQNDLYWARCTAYAKFLGSTKEEVSLGVKWRACDEGLWELVAVPFSKTGRKEPKSTADADVHEMSILLDVLDRIASEDGFLFEF